MNKKYIILIIILGTTIFVFIYFNLKNENDFTKIDMSQFENKIEEESENKIEESDEKEEKIKIHITGEVNVQGIIELKEGDRIADAIEEAGGITDKADVTKINLAYTLEDGQKLYIPSIEDKEIVEKEGIFESEDLLKNEEKNKKVNINKATEEELQKINGVGPSLASKIIKYRKENGNFKTIEDLKNVSGIGDKKFEGIKDYIRVK